MHIYRIERHFSLDRDQTILEAAVRYFDVGFVVIDPLMSFLGDDTDSYNPKEVRNALRGLNVVKRSATILAVIHFRKESAQEVVHMVTSSSAFTEVPRSVLGLGKEPDTEDDDGRLALVHVKCNVGKMQRTRKCSIEQTTVADLGGGEPIEIARIVMGEESDLSKDDVFKPAKQGRPPAQREDAKKFLRTEMMQSGHGYVVIRDAKKKAVPDLCSSDTLKRAAADLGWISEYLDHVGAWVWREFDVPILP